MASPKTDFIHYSIIGVPVENRDDWLTFNARVAGGVEMLPLRRFKGQTVRIYSVKDGDREFAYFEANRLMETGARFEGLFGWNYFFRILPSLISYWIRHGPQRVPAKSRFHHCGPLFEPVSLGRFPSNQRRH